MLKASCEKLGVKQKSTKRRSSMSFKKYFKIGSLLTDTDRQTLAIFWHTGLRYKPLLLRGLLFPAGLVLSNVAVPLYIGKTLGALVVPGGRPLSYFVVFVVAAACGLACNRIGHPAVVKQQALVTRDVQELALVTLFRRSVGFHNNNIGGKLVSDAIDYPAAYTKLQDSVATTLVPLGITLLLGSAIIYAESWQLGLFITITTGIIVGLGVRDSSRMAPRRQIRLQASKALTSHVADTVTNIQTVKTFSREAYELREHKRLSERLTDIRVKDWRRMSVEGNTRLIILAALQALLIFVIIRLVKANPSLLGASIFAFSFTVTLSNRLLEVNMLIRNVEDALLQALPMTKIIHETPEIQDKPSAKKLHVQGGSVVFTDVTFTYEDANETTVFSSLNLNVAPGEKVGLVGPSGGGKSTLTRLLLRFDDINKGSITIDDQDIATVTQESLRHAISYVPQEPLLFHRNIRENIAYGKPGVSLRSIRNAARLAHADEFISKLKDGYDTIVGERGVKLSGGQRQRVAIARAILKNAPLLILDEATSALDSESEVLIQDALWKLMEGRTAIVVAHRLSTIQKMDQIVVLDNGQIVEQGTHKQLLSRKGLYATLWSHQSGGFIKEDE
jgi:ATP-binding cassette, subfamily B, bacterial